MNESMNELIQSVMTDIIFRGRYQVPDCLAILNYCKDHQAVRMYKNKSRLLTLCYCGRCSTIVSEGDKYCNQCGRELYD